MIFTMLKTKIGLLGILVYACVGCHPRVAEIPDNAALEWGETADGLRVSMAVADPRLQKGQSAFVNVVVENTTDQKADISSIPSFTFNAMDYWCPVDILKQGASLPANTKVRIILGGGESLTQRIDLSALFCAPGYSSIWPDQAFFSILPAGAYVLRLDLEVIRGSGSERLFSNEVKVEIVG